MRGLDLGLGMRMNGENTVAPSLVPVPPRLPVVIDTVRDFNAWLLTALTINADASPNYEGDDGTCDQTRSDATTGLHGLGKTLSSLVLGTQYYADLVIKPDGRNYLLFQVSGAGQNAYAMIDLAGNTYGSPNAVDSVTVSSLSNGWKFVRMIFTATASVPYACNLFHATGTNVATDFSAVVGDITKGVLLDRFVLSTF